MYPARLTACLSQGSLRRSLQSRPKERRSKAGRAKEQGKGIRARQNQGNFKARSQGESLANGLFWRESRGENGAKKGQAGRIKGIGKVMFFIIYQYFDIQSARRLLVLCWIRDNMRSLR
jgi:hypothetical protein